MGLALDGLSSGLDTTALINSLMQIEAIPQTLLKNKVYGTQNTVNALQQLNARIASLATLAEGTAKPAALDLFTATTNSEGVTATVGEGASVANLSFVVDKVAQTQVSVTDALTAWPDTAITINGATITAASTSLDDMVTAINESETGVTALKVPAGTDTNGDLQYRLQLTSNTSGVAGAFTVSGTTVTATQIAAAQDAEITLWAGTAAEQSIASATNEFENVLPGVNVTVSKASADPVTLSVTRDAEASAKMAEKLVDALKGVFAMIAAGSAVTDGTDSDGRPVVSGGIFAGDSTVRMVNQKVLSAATAPVNGVSPSSIGVSITKDGTIEFDQEKFDKAFAADPAQVNAVMQALSERVAEAATDVSDKYDGLLTSKITGQESLVENMNAQILEWDGRLAAREATLGRTFVAMEVRLSALNAQSAWLTSQLSSLTPGKEQ